MNEKRKRIGSKIATICQRDMERYAIEYAQFCGRSHDVVIRVYDAAGNVIETHEHASDFCKPRIAEAKGAG
jgi:hypothetical protein